MAETIPEFGRLGTKVNIHPTTLFVNAAQVFIGNNVRIDCFSLLSAGEEGIHIGNNVHLAAGVYVFGSGGKVTLEDFSGLSSRVALYTATDDFTDGYLTGPTVPEKYRKVRRGPIIVRKHVIVGSGCVILPGVELGIGAAVGALTLVRKSCPEFHIIAGNPPRCLGTRNRQVLELEKKYLEETQQG